MYHKVDKGCLLPTFCHQASQEGVLDFNEGPILNADTVETLSTILQKLIGLLEPRQQIFRGYKNRGYKKISLISLTFQHVQARDRFLNYLFLFVEAHMSSASDMTHVKISKALKRFRDLESWTSHKMHNAEAAFASFADNMIINFFMPMKAFAGQTPPQTPVSLSGTPSNVEEIGTRDRLSTLRQDCLIRDGHRCIITKAFDLEEGSDRRTLHGLDAVDDDGILLDDDPDTLEVCHIIPYALTQLGPGTTDDDQLSDSKKLALRILDMFDAGIKHRLNGTDIDRCYNAITLAPRYHKLFRNFDLYFEPSSSGKMHTYDIKQHEKPYKMRTILPTTRTLRSISTVDPPSPRLLALHCAIGRIMHLSAASEYIDFRLRDLHDMKVRADGSSDVETYIGLRLGGWLDSVQVH